MRRFAIFIIALLSLSACSSYVDGADTGDVNSSTPIISELTYSGALGTTRALKGANSINLDTKKEGYTITYSYDSSWESEEEAEDGARFTYLLLTNDAHQQDLVIVAEINTPGVESMHDAKSRREFLNNRYIGEDLNIEETRDVYIRDRDGLSIDFTQVSGNIKMDGIMYTFPWNGYTYAFTYISSGEVGDEQRDVIYAMLNEVEFK